MIPSKNHLILLYFFNLYVLCQGTITQTPTAACVGDRIVVSCVLNVPGAGDTFLSALTSFIVGTSDTLLPASSINDNASHPGVDLSRLGADEPISTDNTMVSGTITLFSYLSSDEGLRLGCSAQYLISGTSNRMFETETLSLDQSEAPSTPSIFQSECFGVSVSWLAPATDRTLTQYYLYRNSSLISTLSNITTQYTDTDPLIPNAAYLYSLAAASCAGNSTSPTILISAPDDNFKIRPGVTRNSSIEPELISIETSAPLFFNYTLYNGTDVIDTLINKAYSDINTLSFGTNFTCDVCYRVTASVLTCTNEIQEVSSKYFILPGVRNGSGYFQNVSKMNPYLRTWIYEFDSPLCSGSDLEEYYYISPNYFEFSLYANETQEFVEITEFNLNFPLDFTFTIPQSSHNLKGTILLRILFNGENLIKGDIMIELPDPPIAIDQTLSTTTIVLICIFIFLLFLLIIVLVLIIVFLIIRKKKQETKE